MELTHGPDGRPVVCPYDHNAPDFATYFDAVTAELVEKAPLVWSEASGGFWLATSYEVVRKLWLDEEHLFIGPNGRDVPWLPAGQALRFVPGEADDEAHDNYRLALNAMFTKEVVDGLLPEIEARIAGALDVLLAQDEFDAINDYAQPIVNGIVCEHLGLAVDDPVAFNKAISEGFRYAGNGSFPSDGVEKRFKAAWGHIVEVVNERRVNPKHDVISLLVQWQDPVLTDDEIQRMTMNVILGAADTVSKLIAQVILYLGQHHDVRDYLVAHPDRIEGAFDEFLRLAMLTMHTGRTARTDFEVAGVKVKAGDRVLLSRWGANHDPTKFPDPYTLHLERNARQHLAFGVGSHSCLGKWFAKAITTSALRELLARAPNYQVDLEHAIVREEVVGPGRWQTMPVRGNASMG
jgi:cytochrome P450